MSDPYGGPNGFPPVALHLTSVMKEADPEAMYREAVKAGLIPTSNTEVMQYQMFEAQVDTAVFGWLPLLVRSLTAELQKHSWYWLHEQLDKVTVSGQPQTFSNAEKKLILNLVTMYVALNFYPYHGEVVPEGIDESLQNTMAYFRGVSERMMIFQALQFRALARTMKDDTRETEREEIPPFGGVHDAEWDDEEDPDEQWTTG